MEKKTFWLIIGIAIAILLIVVVWQTAKISSIASSTANVIQSTGQASSSSGMVGGC